MSNQNFPRKIIECLKQFVTSIQNTLKKIEGESKISISGLKENFSVFLFYGLIVGALSSIGIENISSDQFSKTINEPLSFITFIWLSCTSLVLMIISIATDDNKKSKINSISIPIANSANSAGFIIIGMSAGAIIGLLLGAFLHHSSWTFHPSSWISLKYFHDDQYQQYLHLLLNDSRDFFYRSWLPFVAIQIATLILQLLILSSEMEKRIICPCLIFITIIGAIAYHVEKFTPYLITIIAIPIAIFIFVQLTNKK